MKTKKRKKKCTGWRISQMILIVMISCILEHEDLTLLEVTKKTLLFSHLRSPENSGNKVENM